MLTYTQSIISSQSFVSSAGNCKRLNPLPVSYFLNTYQERYLNAFTTDLYTVKRFFPEWYGK